MDQYLCIGTTFLTNRYHGKEWPPSPARLFQALLAGARTGSYREHWSTVKPILEALERLSAPEVVASSCRQNNQYRIAVPNNDSDKAAREWSAGRSFDAASLRTLKTVAPRELLHGGRMPHVFYLWKTDMGKQVIEGLRRLASFLHTFGWGIDMAYADSFLLNEDGRRALTGLPGYFHLVPARIGQLRDVPVPGYLQDLTDGYERYCNRHSSNGVDPATRATKYGQERYQKVGAIELPMARFALRKLEDSSTPYSVPWALGMKTAAWLRHAAAEALREEGYPNDFVNSYVLGHGNGHDRHMSFVPVPNVGTIHPDGAIRRIMIVEPMGSDGEIAELLQLKLSSSVLHGLVENGNGPRKTEPVCWLQEVQGNDVWRYYTASGRVWNSVTPVVLHGHNSEHGKFSLKKTEQLLYQSFENAGYLRESIEELRFQPAPFWAGTAGSLQMRVPEHLKRWPRYHVAVCFRDPVLGPVFAGIGRHYGIGLFAAAPDRKRKEADPDKEQLS